MKLRGWTLDFYRLPYHREVVWANAVERSGLYALLTLVSEDGASGIAEGTIKDTWSGVSPKSLAAVLEDLLLPKLKQLDLADDKAVSAAFAGIPENRMAKGMVESACWTMRAAVAGKPLWKLWGASGSVEVAWTVTRQKPALMAKESAEVCGKYGFRTLKVKGGQGVDTDLQALKDIRAAVGPGVELYVDANGHYSRVEAAGYVDALAAAGVTVAEDPCRLAPDEHFAKLQAGSPIPILVDRSCASQEDAALYLERGAKALSTKPGRVGLQETRGIATMAAAKGARTAVGIYAESALGTLINLQQEGPMAAEQTFFLTHTAQVSKLMPEIRGGRIALPGEADLSRLVDRDAVRKYMI
ncbi:MAG: mandelate racemase/muconate lactonizing enzyme family protein [Betaproteobacteria bacterium]